MQVDFNLNTIITLAVLVSYLWGYLKNKAFYEAKMDAMKGEIVNVRDELKRMNGSVSEHRSWILKHTECHGEKK